MKRDMKQDCIYIDSHVHFYENFNPDIFIKSVTENFKNLSNKDETKFEKAIKIIFLTESGENDFFNRIKNNSLPMKNKDVHTERTGEECSILIKSNGDSLFYIIRGRQIITEENIEVLSVGPGQKIKDGLPANEVLEILRERDELAILAWGVGKWLFKRGKVVKKLLNSPKAPLLIIGDNSARPSIWFKPFIYRRGEKLGIPIVNGSDPLPLDGETERAGSYFSILKGNFDPNKPLESIKNILKSDTKNIKNLGKRDSLINFLNRQFKIMIKKYT